MERGPRTMTRDLSEEVESSISAEQKRQRMYDSGEYELSETEGFFCEECDWRGLSAPMNHSGTIKERLDGDLSLVLCPECDAGAFTKDSEVDHLEEFRQEYIIDV